MNWGILASVLSGIAIPILLAIVGVLRELSRRIGIQNGRIGKLEEWRTGHEKFGEAMIDEIRGSLDKLQSEARDRAIEARSDRAEILDRVDSLIGSKPKRKR